VSATIFIQFPPEQCPKTLEQTTAIFSTFGEVARIDMSCTSTMGIVIVTFFDVRCVDKALLSFKGSAKNAPPEAFDFRAVSISSSLFTQLPDSFTGFDTFGDIAGVAISGEDMIIEFYDMRAAQRVTMAVPGSRPHLPPPVQKAGVSTTAAGAVPHPDSAGHRARAVLSAFSEQASLLQSQVAGAEVPPSASVAPSRVVAPANQPEAKSPSPVGLVTSPTAANSVGGTSATSNSCQSAGGGGSNKAMPASAAATAAGNVPVREKLDAKDLAKFDVDSEKIKSGEDSRTTVMVRNIPRACSREDFMELLARCGTEHYGFFYMPFDKRRDIHCGFAFVDFHSPHDVLKLYEGLREWPLWLPAPPNGGTPPALSYARLQGQDQLFKHFSLSAVMYDNDQRKRPMFFRGKDGSGPDKAMMEVFGACKEQAPLHSKDNFTADEILSKVADGMQPCYVPLPKLNMQSGVGNLCAGMAGIPGVGVPGCGSDLAIVDSPLMGA